MSETQHHHPQQEHAHFIQSGTRSAKVYQDDLRDASDSTNRVLAKAPALWPLLRCVAVAVASCWCVFVWWCGWVVVLAAGCWLACCSHVHMTHCRLFRPLVHTDTDTFTSTKPQSHPTSHPATYERVSRNPCRATEKPLRATQSHPESQRANQKIHKKTHRGPLKSTEQTQQPCSFFF